MGIKCSVLGHQFEESGSVHEREKRGTELISIEREVLICTHCGTQRVLSESTEVTTVANVEDSADDEGIDHRSDDSADDQQLDDEGEDTLEETVDAAPIDERSVEETVDDQPIDEISVGEDAVEEETEAGQDSERAVSEGIDVIQDDDSDSHPSEAAADSDSHSSETADSDSHSSETADNDSPSVEAIDSDSRPSTDDDGIVLTDVDVRGRRYGEWPTDSNTEYESWNPDDLRTTIETADSQRADRPAVSEDSVREASASQSSDGRLIDHTSDESTGQNEEILHCPACGFTAIASDSPFRLGDSCPECQQTYLVHNTDREDTSDGERNA